MFCSYAYAQPRLSPNIKIRIQDEGGTKQGPVYTIDCVGDNIDCSYNSGTGTITISGGAGTVGGTTNELLYNNAGTEDGITGVTSTDGDSVTVSTTLYLEEGVPLAIDSRATLPKNQGQLRFDGYDWYLNSDGPTSAGSLFINNNYNDGPYGNADPGIEMHGDDNDVPGITTINYGDGPNAYPHWSMFRGAGTWDSKSVVSDDMYIGQLDVRAWHGGSWLSVFTMDVIMDEPTPSSTKLGSEIIFCSTKTGDNTCITALTIEGNNDITIAGSIIVQGNEAVLPTGSVDGSEIEDDSVVLATDTSGNYVATIIGGDGVSSTGATTGENIAHTLAVDLKTVAENGVGTTGSASGLEFESAQLTILQGCSDNQILKWDEGTDRWQCNSDDSGVPGEDSVGLTEIDDNANSPEVGDILTVDTNTDSIRYRTITETFAAGNALTWSGTTINFDGGASPSNDLSGTWASPTIAANAVAMGTDTTGNYVASITGGDGITSTGATTGENIAHTLSIDLKISSQDGGATTTSVSGLEFVSGELTMLQGCTDGQVLKWREDLDKWHCQDDNEAAGGGGTPGGSDTQIQYNNSGSFGGVSGFTSDGTNITATGTFDASSGGITLPQGTSANDTTEGAIQWDSDNDKLVVGTTTGTQLVGALKLIETNFDTGVSATVRWSLKEDRRYILYLNLAKDGTSNHYDIVFNNDTSGNNYSYCVWETSDNSSSLAVACSGYGNNECNAFAYGGKNNPAHMEIHIDTHDDDGVFDVSAISHASSVAGTSTNRWDRGSCLYNGGTVTDIEINTDNGNFDYDGELYEVLQ